MHSEFPLSVLYCPVCTYPPEYCEFSASFAQCKDWIARNCPELYPHLAEDFERILLGQGPVEETKVKKVKFKEPKQVVLAPLSRGGKKTVIEISGLALFNVSLKDAAKLLRKSLCTGCNAVEENLEVQGNAIPQIVQLLLATYPQILPHQLIVKDPSTKKKKKK